MRDPTTSDVQDRVREPRPGVVGAGKPWLVFFGEDWGRLNSTGQCLAAELARTHRVLWVNSLGLRAPRPCLADARRVAAKLAAFVRSSLQGTDAAADRDHRPADLDVFAPLALPWLRWRAVRRLNRRLLAHQLLKVRQRLGITDPVVISACPATADIMDVFAPSRTLYYCADEYAAHPGMNAELVRMLEKRLMDRVQVVAACSRALRQRKSLNHPDVRYLPHGVRYEHLYRAVRGGLACPPCLRGASGPVVGYLGSIGRHLDYELIQAVAECLPEARIVMAGPVEPDAGPLPRADNLVYTGAIPYARVPNYLARFQVALLPWTLDDRVRYAHPTKLREYLAAGCLVVSTPHPEVEDVSPYIESPVDTQAFIAAVSRQLRRRRAVPRAVVAAPMRAHDWSVRADRLRSMFAPAAEAARDLSP